MFQQMQMKNDFPVNKQSRKYNQSKTLNPIKRLLINQALRCEIKDYILVDKNQKVKLEK
jgi:hypothetical protein